MGEPIVLLILSGTMPPKHQEGGNELEGDWMEDTIAQKVLMINTYDGSENDKRRETRERGIKEKS